MTDGANLIGSTEVELEAALGTPSSRSVIGADIWLVFALSDLTVRVRCTNSGGMACCASWTAVFPSGFQTLSEAASLVGLWPHVQPDENAADVALPLIRRRLIRQDGDSDHSFTAGVRNALIVSVSAFDEEPDWV